MWKLFIYCSLAIFAFTSCIEVDPCSDDIPGAVEFVSEGCDKIPCPLVRGTTSNVNITFRIPYDVANSTVKIEAKVQGTGFWVKFPPKDSNTCHNLLNSYCPLDENEIVVYHLAIPVLKLYPKFKMTLKVQFLDEKNKAMMCMLLPCQVVDAK